VPAVILGLLFGKAIKAHLFTPAVVATTFIVGGFIILWAERRRGAVGNAARVHSVDDMTAAGRPQGRPGAVPGHGAGHQPQWRHHHRRHAAGPVAQGRDATFPFYLGDTHPDRRGRLQPLQGARAARRWPMRRMFACGAGGLVHECVAVRALVAASFIATHSFVGLCVLPHRVRRASVLVTAWTGLVVWAE